MKKILPLLFIILLCSCSTKDIDSLLLLDETVEMSNLYLSGNAEMHYGEIAGKYEANKRLTEPYKVISDSIGIRHAEIIEKFNQIKEDYKKTNNDRSYILGKIQDGIPELIVLIDAYKDYLTKALKDSTLVSAIIDFLEIKNYNPENIKYTELNLIINEFNLVHYLVISSIDNKMSSKRLNWLKYKPVVIQNKAILKSGQTLKAKIYLTVMDTTFEQQVIIGKDTLTQRTESFTIKRKPNKKETGKLKEKS